MRLERTTQYPRPQDCFRAAALNAGVDSRSPMSSPETSVKRDLLQWQKRPTAGVFPETNVSANLSLSLPAWEGTGGEDSRYGRVFFLLEVILVDTTRISVDALALLPVRHFHAVQV
jgi:hypothetical protein